MRGFKIAELGGDTSELENSRGNLLYKTAELKWSDPIHWQKRQRIPNLDTDDPLLYALVHNHGNSATRDRIMYIGLTYNPKGRFANHPTARTIRDKPGETTLSYAIVNFIRGRDRIKRIKRALEEIEHLLIWSLYYNLENKQKYLTLPGMSSHSANAWHIKNTGYRFSGQMPKEIIYPWMLVKPNPNRTQRARE